MVLCRGHLPPAILSCLLLFDSSASSAFILHTTFSQTARQASSSICIAMVLDENSSAFQPSTSLFHLHIYCSTPRIVHRTYALSPNETCLEKAFLDQVLSPNVLPTFTVALLEIQAVSSALHLSRLRVLRTWYKRLLALRGYSPSCFHFFVCSLPHS